MQADAEQTTAAATDKERLGRAVFYVRVSSTQQADTDYDKEGFSIPAQREACLRKASSLGLQVVEEFVDRGESAKTANRPGLQALLTRLEQGDIQAVIVHKVDRLARNRADDVAIVMRIRGHGAQLVSATENIDETPSGLLLHGIMSSIAEFYSRNLATEIIKVLDRERLTVRAAHARSGIAAADFSRIRNADLGRFTADRLITVLNRLGSRVEVKVRVRPAESAE